ncbi:MAG: Gfo/Idh/MocA family oxidoreductase [Thermoguttaceae bacterium]
MSTSASSKTRSRSRREFLRLSGTAAAASVLTGAAAPRCHAAENNTIKLALVGCGGRGTGAVVDALSTSGGPVKLFAMADVFENRLKGSLGQLQKRYEKAIDVPPERQFAGFDAYRKAIDCLSPGDVVLLTTHAAFRPLHFEYAVRKGIHVFMEKSFAVDVPATRRLKQANEEAKKKNLKVSVGLMWRHSNSRQEVIRRIHDGAIGDVQFLRIYRIHGPHHCPLVPAGANPLAFQIQHAFSFNWLCSGFLVDWHCHNIDVACWAKGAWPIAAQGMAGRCYPQAGNLLDHYAVEFTFADGAKLFAYSRHMNGCWDEYADYAHGTKGSAVLMTNLQRPNTRIYKTQQMTPENLVWQGPAEVNPYLVEWQVLVDAIRQDKPHNEADRAIDANMASLMGRMAAHTGKYVTRQEAEASTFEYVKEIEHMTFDTPAPILPGADGIYPCPLPGATKEI